MRHFLILWVKAYQWFVSPLKTALLGPGARCRFEPSCSEYAVTALERHGVWRGGSLAVGRVCRCHPWGGCGHDPVPPLDPGFRGSRVGAARRLTRDGGDSRRLRRRVA